MLLYMGKGIRGGGIEERKMLFLTTGTPLFQSRDFLSEIRHRSGPTSGIEPSSVEVDFFFDVKDKKKIRIERVKLELDLKVQGLGIKKEDLTINLMTIANTGSDQPTVDDVASANYEDTKGRNETVLQKLHPHFQSHQHLHYSQLHHCQPSAGVNGVNVTFLIKLHKYIYDCVVKGAL